jgi:uncharacterized membrane protein
MEDRNSKVWQATLTPHRSLTKEGFLAVMGLVVVVNLVVGGMFVLLVWWAFRANFADARQLERISITEHELVFDRLRENHPPEQQRFVRRWVRIELEEDRERELIGRLLLISGPTRLAVGDFLPPEERKSLATALKSALAIPRI